MAHCVRCSPSHRSVAAADPVSGNRRAEGRRSATRSCRRRKTSEALVTCRRQARSQRSRRSTNRVIHPVSSRLKILAGAAVLKRPVNRLQPVQRTSSALPDETVPVATNRVDLLWCEGPAGISCDPCCPGFRASLGNPVLIEDALNRHPKLRVNLMHPGWPYLAETIATVRTYPQVNMDLGWLNWGSAQTGVPRVCGSFDAGGVRQADHVRVRSHVLA